MRRQLSLSAVLASGLVACSSVPRDTKDLLEQPIDCAYANIDIALLNAAVPSGSQRVVSGARSVSPVGVVTGVARRDYGGNIKVASGGLAREIEARIAEINAVCGLEPEGPEQAGQAE